MIISNSTSHVTELTRPGQAAVLYIAKRISERRADGVHTDIKAHMKGLYQHREFQETFIFRSVIQSYVIIALY
jgi:hypothetical protein